VTPVKKNPSDRPGFVRLGMFVTREASDALEGFCAAHGVGQAEVLEGAILFLRPDDLVAAVKEAVVARKAARANRLELKRELAKMSPDELAALLAKRGSPE
jgi:hypothetical protein